jgi:maltooligosyltrehalose trehalohydrolase
MFRETNCEIRQIGVNFNKTGEATIVLWAPAATQVKIKIESLVTSIALEPEAYGYWQLTTDQLLPGQRYNFELTTANGVLQRADPASLFQPEGVHGPSEAVNLRDYPFTDQQWQTVPLNEYIIYELHVGTFSPDENFLGIEQKLDHLIELGITAIEIMPVATFPGNRNWGYDGVFPFAVQGSYGGPVGLQNLVNACHQKGLSVILDVVYNHFGPEGNYFADFAPYFTDKYQTPWGKAINFDDAFSDGVRHFFIENVLQWFRDFHIDALRLDAVHAIRDLSAKHILAEIKESVAILSTHTGKNYHLIVECDLNDPKYINLLAKQGYGMDAQWMDEFHHALRVAAGQKREGYYTDFNGIADLAKSYQDAYVYDGTFSEERKKTFGAKATENPGQQFIVFSQNHDQVGNRMLGERTSQLVSFEMQKLLAGAVFVAPFIPLLFMGEEWAAPNPFLYFVSHSDQELIKAVQNGRAAEFKAFHLEGEAPDPQDPQTFAESKLQWEILNEAKHQQMFAYYRSLIALRKNNVVLKNLDREKLTVTVLTAQNSLILKRWQADECIVCVLNFSPTAQNVDLPMEQERPLTRLFDSGASIWGGQSTASEIINANENVIVQPESLVIYTQTNE